MYSVYCKTREKIFVFLYIRISNASTEIRLVQTVRIFDEFFNIQLINVTFFRYLRRYLVQNPIHIIHIYIYGEYGIPDLDLLSEKSFRGTKYLRIGTQFGIVRCLNVSNDFSHRRRRRAAVVRRNIFPTSHHRNIIIRKITCVFLSALNFFFLLPGLN